MNAALVALARETLGAEALPLGGDIWAELGGCLQ